MGSFTDMIGGSGDARADRFDKLEYENVLIAVIHPYGKQVDSQFGETTAAFMKYIVVLEGADAGRVFEGAALFGTVLVPALLDADSAIIVGKLVQGKAKGGHNAPWLWEDGSADDFAVAGAWFDANAKKDADGTIAINVDSF